MNSSEAGREKTCMSCGWRCYWDEQSRLSAEAACIRCADGAPRPNANNVTFREWIPFEGNKERRAEIDAALRAQPQQGQGIASKNTDQSKEVLVAQAGPLNIRRTRKIGFMDALEKYLKAREVVFQGINKYAMQQILDECYNEMAVVFAISAAPPLAAAQGGWVSVEERLPEFGDTVLVATEFDALGDWRIKTGGYFLPGIWRVIGGSWTPTHWQPLPAPPQEKK